jgi:hypothetical protein
MTRRRRPLQGQSRSSSLAEIIERGRLPAQGDTPAAVRVTFVPLTRLSPTSRGRPNHNAGFDVLRFEEAAYASPFARAYYSALMGPSGRSVAHSASYGLSLLQDPSFGHQIASQKPHRRRCGSDVPEKSGTAKRRGGDPTRKRRQGYRLALAPCPSRRSLVHTPRKKSHREWLRRGPLGGRRPDGRGGRGPILSAFSNAPNQPPETTSPPARRRPLMDPEHHFIL